MSVALVVLMHYGGTIRGAFLAVQAFFVLSGFLITQILMADRDLPIGPYLKRFYYRRALRIFPVYYAFLPVLFLLMWLTGEPSGLRGDWPSLVTYTFNFRYFDPSFVMVRGIHYAQFWSLCVEEQFYLVWPILFYLCPVEKLKKLVVAIALLGPVTRFVVGRYIQAHVVPGFLGYRDWDAIYWHPLSHIDAFSCGIVIALFRLPERMRGTGKLIVALGALALALGGGVLCALYLAGRPVVWRSFGYDLPLPDFAAQYVWGYSVFNFFYAALLVGLLQDHPRLRFFRHRVLVQIGKVSYGMYVFHMALILVVHRYVVGGLTELAPRYPLVGPNASLRAVLVFAAYVSIFPLYLGVLYALTYLSYRYLETPFLRLKDVGPGRRRRGLSVQPGAG